MQKSAKAVGIITYVTAFDTQNTKASELGLILAEIQYIYDMEVGPEVQPVPVEGENSDFRLYTLQGVNTTLEDGDFTPANACLVLDFCEAWTRHIRK